SKVFSLRTNGRKSRKTKNNKPKSRAIIESDSEEEIAAESVSLPSQPAPLPVAVAMDTSGPNEHVVAATAAAAAAAVSDTTPPDSRPPTPGSPEYDQQKMDTNADVHLITTPSPNKRKGTIESSL